MSDDFDKCKHFEYCGLTSEADPENSLCILHSQKQDKDIEAFNRVLGIHQINHGNKYCLFCFPEKVEVEDDTIHGEIEFSHCEFQEGISFKYCIFEEDVSFHGSKINGEMNFWGSCFTKGSIFSEITVSGSAEFGECLFGKAADFSHSIFSKALIFSCSYICGDANFSRCTFDKEFQNFRMVVKGNLIFDQSKFNEDQEFLQCYCYGKSSYVYAEFNGNVLFQELETEYDADFMMAKFNKDVEFNDFQVNNGVYALVGATFNGVTKFVTNRRVRKEPLFNDVFINFRKVSVKSGKNIHFSDVDLRKCVFEDTRINEFNFVNVIWPRGDNRYQVYDEILSQTKDSGNFWGRLESLYTDLQVNYEKNHDYSRGGDFHYGAKNARRKNSDTTFSHKIFLTLYWLISGYGERYVRPLLWAGVLLFASTIGYLYFGLQEKSSTRLLEINNIYDWGNALLYSFEIMTIQKPEGLSVIGFAKAVKAIEAILGPVILGFFALALRQRLKR